jgi:hypothetical protein
MKFDFPRYKQNGESKKPLPKPNATMKMSGSGEQFTEDEIRGFFANPIYAGVGPYSPLIPDDEWIRCAAKDIRHEGAEQYLVNLLHLLRQSFKNAQLDL